MCVSQTMGNTQNPLTGGKMETEKKWCPDHQKETEHVKEKVEDREVWVCQECWDELYNGKFELPQIRPIY